MKRPTRPTLWLLPLIALACGQEETLRAEGPPPVLVERVGAFEVLDRIEATGELKAKSEATVAAQVRGQITGIVVEEGDAVEAQQVLLEIDPERRLLERNDASARADEAAARVREQERENRRIQTLGERGAVSRARLDQSDTELALARSQQAGAAARLGLAERALRDSTVRAPFSGLVAKRTVSTGEFVSPGQQLFELVTLDPVEVEFHLAEADSSRVEIGHPVTVRVAPYPDEEFRATVTVIAPTIDRRTRTLRVKAVLPNPDGRLRPGLFARADLGIDRRSGVPMVPEQAVLQRADGAVLFLLSEEERVKRVRVRTGIHRDRMVEILEGVKPGDQVVVRGHADLIDGTPVSVRQLDGSSPELDLAAQ